MFDYHWQRHLHLEEINRGMDEDHLQVKYEEDNWGICDNVTDTYYERLRQALLEDSTKEEEALNKMAIVTDSYLQRWYENLFNMFEKRAFLIDQRNTIISNE